MKLPINLSLLVVLLSCSDSKFNGSTPVVPEKPVVSAQTNDAIPPTANSEPEEVQKAESPAVMSSTQVEEIGTVALPPVAAEVKASCADASKVIKMPTQKLTFAERPKTKASTCKFGVAPNIAADDGTLTAIEVTSQTIKLPPAGSIICSVEMKSEEMAKFNYDDMLVMKLENNIIFASTDNLLLEKFVGPKPADGVYVWDFSKLVGHKDAEGLAFHTGKAYCLDSTAACIIPKTQETGPVSVSLGASVFSPISARIFNKSSVSLDLVVMGDNDDGNLYKGKQTQPTDCTHSELSMNVDVSYVTSK